MTRRRLALALWIAISIALWNGLYDMRISLGIRGHLFNAALHQAGRGPEVVMSDDMRETVKDAVFVATLWASIVLAAGIATVIGLSPAKRT